MTEGDFDEMRGYEMRPFFFIKLEKTQLKKKKKFK